MNIKTSRRFTQNALMFYDKRLGVCKKALYGSLQKKGDISTDCPLFLLYLSQIRF